MNDSIITSSFLRQVIASFPLPVNPMIAPCRASHKKLVPTDLFTVLLLSVRAAKSKLILLSPQLLLYEINHPQKADICRNRHTATIVHSLKKDTSKSAISKSILTLQLCTDRRFNNNISFFNGRPQFFIKIHFYHLHKAFLILLPH